MSFLKQVYAKRKPLADVLADEEYSGIREIVEELYPDKAHFIYELLQNAEDTGATTVSFSLYEDRLIFEHNGLPFREVDVWGITNIGKGSKKDDDEAIGKFGVGFKAVFAYTETPRVWSPTIAFEISELVLPTELDAKPNLGKITHFEFPFNNPKKSANDAYAEIWDGLNDLSETTLLFLSHIESVSWELPGKSMGEILRVGHSEHHIEVLKQVEGKTAASSHFLRVSAPVTGLGKQRIAIAFELEKLPKAINPKSKKLSAQFKIVSAQPGRVAVFFPADKETSGLRFHLHAPFVPELSRASIKETPVNKPLFEQLAELTAASLHRIRDLGLLTVDYLAVLPNPQDQLPLRYQGIREAIIDAMNTQPLTPTYDKSHAPAQVLLQAKAALKELLAIEDIEFLVDYDKGPPQWAASAAQKNSNADRFLAGLDITDWDTDKFVELLSDKATVGIHGSSHPPYVFYDVNDGFMQWLSGKSLEWHQNMYVLLYQDLESRGTLSKLKKVMIILLADGGHSPGDKCYFPSDGGEQNELFPRVNADVYLSGKHKVRQEIARKFLEEVGVREIGEAEQIEAVLKQRYDSQKTDTFSPDLADIVRFIAFFEKYPGEAAMFSGYAVLKCKWGNWICPKQVFLDVPFVETGLRAWCESLGKRTGNVALSDDYLSCGVEIGKIVKFAKAVGAQTDLTITATNCFANPRYWDYLRFVAGERHTSPIDEDYVISGLEKVLSNPSIDISRLLWRTMCSLPSHPHWPVQNQPFLNALYQKNETNGCRRADSQLVCHLKSHKWIPQGDGSFVYPKDALREFLPAGFAYDEGYKWLEAIGFGEAVSKKKEAAAQEQETQQTRRNLAVLLGFPDEQTFDDAQKFAELPSADRQWLMEEIERKKQTALPEHEPRNPERRAGLVGQQASDAPEKLTEKRQRSVSGEREEVKKEAAQYLFQQYTNRDGVTFCQVCKAALPFKLDDGSYYFEKVEFVTDLAKRHHQNYLALCPNHAAMFQHANGTKDLMQEMFAELTGNELEVVLAQADATIYFTKTHIADLQVVISTEAEAIELEEAETEEEGDA